MTLLPEDGSPGEHDVLAQPTRARLFAGLRRLGRPAGTEELAAQLGLHPSGVRIHLGRLRRAGLVTRERVPQGTGRPRDAWSVAPEALPGSEPPEAYRLLAGWLARGIGAGAASVRGLERTGREIGRELAPAPGEGSSAARLGRSLTGLGFAPQRERSSSERTVFRLGHCPYRQAVRANQPVVCTLHRGITRGLLEAIEPGADLIAFIPRDPEHAGCLIEVEGLAAG